MSLQNFTERQYGKPINKCRMCRCDRLVKFLDLGFTPLSDAFLKKEDLKNPEIYYPLEVYMCRDCGLMQLGFVVSPAILYRNEYPYESSTTQTGREHFFNMAKVICERFKLKPGSLVIDVGSNVGVLLDGFRRQNMKVFGVDPAKDMADIANAHGIETISEFFSSDIARKIVREKGSASVITATNSFAHIDDLHDVVKAIDILLDDNGIFVVEAPYFIDLVNNLEYDTIYHEHLAYLSIKPLVKFFKRFGMKLFDVERIKIHGGTIRFFVTRQKNTMPVSSRVAELLKLEDKAGIYSIDTLQRFSDKVKEHRLLLNSMLRNIKAQGKKVVGVSAPAKGNTLLNYSKIDQDLLPYITEKARIKIGLFTPGTHIPIYSDEKLFEDQPDYVLILAWNFADEIMGNLSEFQNRGGKFIIPIPTPKIL